MSDKERNDTDLVLTPIEYAYIRNETKGDVLLYVGPCIRTISQTDTPVVFNDGQSKRFERVPLEQSKQLFTIAPEGWYIQLKNPAKPDNAHPTVGGAPQVPDLDVGRKVNIPGPASFALWPGQMARVIQGHRLKSNQFLVARVYDDVATQAWLDEERGPDPEGAEESGSTKEVVGFRRKLAQAVKGHVVIGQLIIIKGTEVSFFMPPTGLEVLRGDDGGFVREAETLERLEYCQLKDQDGNKRYVRGPDVVFPKPTEEFASKIEDGVVVRKFRAIELNPTSGIYIKVIEDYEDGEEKHKRGDELFITGATQRIYFPREEHAVISYGSATQVHYGVALPKGEGRYVLDREQGSVNIVKGPQVFLPNPIRQVVVRRVLSTRQCELWYPNNAEALQHNQALSKVKTEEKTKGGIITPDRGSFNLGVMRGLSGSLAYASDGGGEYFESGVGSPYSPEFQGDEFSRKEGYTKPRTITLDTKYDGVVTVSAWDGYAMMVVDHSGRREVIEGPATRMLEYDEELQPLLLSRGRPKGTGGKLETVYLRTTNNRVGDLVEVETNDFTTVNLHLSYRVRFVGDKDKWFAVSDYTKLLSDHLRSKIRREAMTHDVEDFYHNAADIVRNVVLGKQDEKGERPLTTFDENNMQVYDVEVLNVDILDSTIQNLLIDAQRDTISQIVAVAKSRRRVATSVALHELKREERNAEEETNRHDAQKRREQVLSEMEVSKVKAASEAEKRTFAKSLQAQDSEILTAQLADKQREFEQKLGEDKANQDLILAKLKAEAENLAEKMSSIQPSFIRALQGIGDKATLQHMTSALSVYGMVDMMRGKSMLGAVKRLVAGTPMADALPEGSWPEDEPTNGGNGSGARGRGARAR